MKGKPHPDMSFEMEARASGFLCVAGVDEAGRGPLAGPVVAGAVILPVLAEELTGLNDSKTNLPAWIFPRISWRPFWLSGRTDFPLTIL